MLFRFPAGTAFMLFFPAGNGVFPSILTILCIISHGSQLMFLLFWTLLWARFVSRSWRAVDQLFFYGAIGKRKGRMHPIHANFDYFVRFLSSDYERLTMMLRCFFYPSHAPELDWQNTACVWNIGQSIKPACASAPFSLRGDVSSITELRIATWTASSSSALLHVRGTQAARAIWPSTCVDYLSICSHVLPRPHTPSDETMLFQKISLFSYIFVMLSIFILLCRRIFL